MHQRPYDLKNTDRHSITAGSPFIGVALRILSEQYVDDLSERGEFTGGYVFVTGTIVEVSTR